MGYLCQRFVVSIRNQKGKDNYNKILNNADSFGRKVMTGQFA